MFEEVAVPQGQISEGEDEGEGSPEDWGRGQCEAALEVYGGVGLPGAIPPRQRDHLQPPASGPTPGVGNGGDGGAGRLVRLLGSSGRRWSFRCASSDAASGRGRCAVTPSSSSNGRCGSARCAGSHSSPSSSRPWTCGQNQPVACAATRRGQGKEEA